MSTYTEKVIDKPASPMTEPAGPWYAGVTRYQWLVLIIASLGWAFDIFEVQIFVVSMNEAMPSLVAPGTTAGDIAFYNNLVLSTYLLGGALGGIIFGMLADRFGRKRMLSFTIAFYSIFTCLSGLSTEVWHLVAFRFLVALGIGGEWAIGSALVAEVFPARARAHAGGIFHASSVLGTYMATAAGFFLLGSPALQLWSQQIGEGWIGQYVDPATLPWRITFFLGLLPALLIVWVRRSVREPEGWQAARLQSRSTVGQRMGVLGDLFRSSLLPRTLVGIMLATIGLSTFYGAHIYGKNMLQAAVERDYVEEALQARSDGAAPTPFLAQTTPIQDPSALTEAQRQNILQERATDLKRWEMLGLFLVTTGGGLGLLAFGPISQRIGRRKAFLMYQLGGLASVFVVFQLLDGVGALIVALPVFGFLTLGMHAGFAIYFPELYPTRLRGSGVGFCFNAGRILAAPVIFLVGWMQAEAGMTLPNVATWLGLLFLIGCVALLFAPETRGEPLPE